MWLDLNLPILILNVLLVAKVGVVGILGRACIPCYFVFPCIFGSAAGMGD
jgi:hypothetical protein